ncbi:MAG: hypothetical protein RIF32_22625 [Leptospirales bacterium]
MNPAPAKSMLLFLENYDLSPGQLAMARTLTGVAGYLAIENAHLDAETQTIAGRMSVYGGMLQVRATLPGPARRDLQLQFTFKDSVSGAPGGFSVGALQLTVTIPEEPAEREPTGLATGVVAGIPVEGRLMVNAGWSRGNAEPCYWILEAAASSSPRFDSFLDFAGTKFAGIAEKLADLAATAIQHVRLEISPLSSRLILRAPAARWELINGFHVQNPSLRISQANNPLFGADMRLAIDGTFLSGSKSFDLTVEFERRGQTADPGRQPPTDAMATALRDSDMIYHLRCTGKDGAALRPGEVMASALPAADWIPDGFRERLEKTTLEEVELIYHSAGQARFAAVGQFLGVHSRLDLERFSIAPESYLACRVHISQPEQSLREIFQNLLGYADGPPDWLPDLRLAVEELALDQYRAWCAIQGRLRLGDLSPLAGRLEIHYAAAARRYRISLETRGAGVSLAGICASIGLDVSVLADRWSLLGELFEASLSALDLEFAGASGTRIAAELTVFETWRLAFEYSATRFGNESVVRVRARLDCPPLALREMPRKLGLIHPDHDESFWNSFLPDLQIQPTFLSYDQNSGALSIAFQAGLGQTQIACELGSTGEAPGQRAYRLVFRTSPGRMLPVGEFFDSVLSRIFADTGLRNIVESLAPGLDRVAVSDVHVQLEHSAGSVTGVVECTLHLPFGAKTFPFHIQYPDPAEPQLKLPAVIFRPRAGVEFSGHLGRGGFTIACTGDVEIDLKADFGALLPDSVAALIPDVSLSLAAARLSYRRGAGGRDPGIALFVQSTIDIHFGGVAEMIGTGHQLRDAGFRDISLLLTGGEWTAPDLGEVYPYALEESDPGPHWYLDGLAYAGTYSERIQIPLRGRGASGAKPSQPAARLFDHSSAAMHSSMESRSGPAPLARVAVPAASPRADYKWFDLNRKAGPVRLSRVGVALSPDGKVAIAVDADLFLGNLVLSLDGLALRNPLNRFDPEFDLKGLGVSSARPDFEVSGGRVIDYDDQGRRQFSGGLVIKNEALTLRVVAAYSQLDQGVSLFIYGLLDKQFGGPPFFFVTGLSLAFGYNRGLHMPGLEEVQDFYLLRQAMQPAGTPSPGPLAALDGLSTAVFPAEDRHFFALGVRFTSFKMIETLALLILRFEPDLRIDVLGLSRLTIPFNSPHDPLVKIEIAFIAAYAPDRGELRVTGRITPGSYAFSRNCHLSGGFAFYSWFHGSHAGDFVFSMGGYHPDFRVPAHYPRVPRLAFNWPVDSRTLVKGSLYFALTPHALMAGGTLEATYRSGRLEAWFTVAADFLIYWEPYHYSAHFRVRIGVKYRAKFLFIDETLRMTLGVDLRIWGPEFGGRASLDLGITTVTVKFGNQNSRTPLPLRTWREFVQKFLPARSEIWSIRVADGLLNQIEGAQTIYAVAPSTLSIQIQSLIPITHCEDLNGSSSYIWSAAASGVAPMSVGHGDFKSRLKIRAERRGPGHSFVNMRVTPIEKAAPAALWGTSARPALNAETRTLPRVWFGIQLDVFEPELPHEADGVLSRPLADFRYAPESVAQSTSGVVAAPGFRAGFSNETQDQAALRNDPVLAEFLGGKE